MISTVLKDEALENASDIVTLLSQGSGPFISEEARVKALEAANKVIRVLEKPEDGLIKFAFSVSRNYDDWYNGSAECEKSDIVRSQRLGWLFVYAHS